MDSNLSSKNFDIKNFHIGDLIFEVSIFVNSDGNHVRNISITDNTLVNKKIGYENMEKIINIPFTEPNTFNTVNVKDEYKYESIKNEKELERFSKFILNSLKIN